LNRGNRSQQFFDWADRFDPRVDGLEGKKGTLFRYVPTVGTPLLLMKQDDGFTRNWTPSGEGDQEHIYYVGTGDLITIQDAIDLAFAQGSGTDGIIATIYVPPGQYQENLIFKPGQVIIAQSAQVAVGAVIIEGQHSYTPPVNSDPLAVLLNLQGLSFLNVANGHTISFLGPNGALFSMSGCSFSKDGTGSSIFGSNANAIYIVASCSTTSYPATDPVIETDCAIMVVNQVSHSSGGSAPLLNWVNGGGGTLQMSQNNVIGSAPYIIQISNGNSIVTYNTFVTFNPDSDGIRIASPATMILTFTSILSSTSSGFVLQGDGTVSGAMLVYPGGNAKDPSLTFNLFNSDPS
jgi:hypothetical protein